MLVQWSPQGRLDSGQLGKATTAPEAQGRREQTTITSHSGREGLKNLSERSLSGNVGKIWVTLCRVSASGGCQQKVVLFLMISGLTHATSLTVFSSLGQMRLTRKRWRRRSWAPH